MLINLFYPLLVLLAAVLIAYLLSENQELKKLISDPNFNKQQATIAFNKAEDWRREKIALIYDNVTDEELDKAKRWLSYANPFSSDKSCLSCLGKWKTNTSIIELYENIKKFWAQNFFWDETCRKSYLTLHAFHTTGIEGNTLTLSETALIVNGQPLFAGFKDELNPPLTQNSLREVKNIKRIIDALKFSSPPTQEPAFIFNKQTLVDINSAIIDNLSSTGFRRHPVAVGHQLIVLPMPDEVDYLVTMYINWLNKQIEVFSESLRKDDLDYSEIFLNILSIACDAHTRFVHIHPFSDGNGRLARIISGMVLRNVLLPMPMFSKEERQIYISSVGKATIDGDHSPICLLHYIAVKRSISTMLELSSNNCSLKYSDNY